MTLRPVRVQARRLIGWRKPPGTRYVTRNTRYGNPFLVSKGGGRYAVSWVGKGAGIDRSPPAGFEPLTFDTEREAHEESVRLFRSWFTAPEQSDLLALARRELLGLNLACSCPPSLPCHADVLLSEVNR